MKKVNGMTVYEENDICALDEYSEQIEKDITQKIKEKETDIANIQKEQITQKNKITSLETDNTSNKTNITQIKEKNTEQDTKLSKLEIENTELKSENERLREDLKGLPKGAFSGESIDLNDSADMRLQRLEIGGNSRQKINLYTGGLEQGSISSTGNVDANNRVRTSEYTEVKENTKIIVKATGAEQYALVFYNINHDVISISSFIDLGIETEIIANTKYIKVILRKSNNSNINVNDITSFVIGNTPSPNYPSEIECCGDNVNMFEATSKSFTYNNAYLNYNNEQNEYHILSSQIWFRNTINNLELNETYTISFDAKISNSETSSAEIKQLFRIDKPSDGTPLKYFDNNILLENEYKRYSLSFTATETTLWATIRNTDEIEAYIKNVKLTKGTSDTYSKFGQGNISFEMCNKNLAKTSKVGQHGTPIIKFSEKYTGPLTIAMKPISGNTQLNYRFFYADGTAGGDNSVTLVNTENNKWYCISLNVKNVIGIGTYNVVRQGYTNRTLEKQFIAKGQYSIQSDKDYIEHKSQTYTIPTQKPFRKIDSYKDVFINKNGKWYERHLAKREILKGTENWTKSLSAQNGYYTSTFVNYIGESLKWFSNMFKIANVNEYNSNTDNYLVYINNANKNISISLPTKIASTVEEFKAFLQEKYNSGTPVYIDYVLSEPKDIECTVEQTEILDKIENEAKTYKRVTHIYSTDEISPVFEGTYNKDIEAMINNIATTVAEREE